MTGGAVRAFCAVSPSAAARAELSALQERLRPSVEGLRWVRPEALHLTLRFFGDIEPPEVESVSRCLDAVAGAAVPFPLSLGRVGTFPDGRRPRVLWLGVDRGRPRLEALARELERRFVEAGLGAADKEFRPHLTLGRWRDPGRGLSPQTHHPASAVTFLAEEVLLYRSELGSDGPRYTVLHRAALAGGG